MEENKKGLLNIDIDDVTIGMYLEYPVYDHKDNLLQSPNIVFTSKYQISKLKNSGVLSITINLEKSQLDRKTLVDVLRKYAKKKKAVGLDDKTMQFAAERKQVKPVYDKSKQIMKRFFNSIKNASYNFIESVEEIADLFYQSLENNEDALPSIIKCSETTQYNIDHAVNVSIMAIFIGKKLGMEEKELKELGMGGLLHDVGMLRVPFKLTQKPGKLTENEWRIVRNHPVYGTEILENYRGIPDSVFKCVLHHHERWDGSGYPKQLRENQISRFGLITSIADVYDALTSRKIYREAVLPHVAVSMIYKFKNKGFNADLVDFFAKNLGIFPIGSVVKLSNNSIGIVTSVNHDNLLFPEVRIIFDHKGNKIDSPYELNLSKTINYEKISIVRVLDQREYQINPDDYF